MDRVRGGRSRCPRVRDHALAHRPAPLERHGVVRTSTARPNAASVRRARDQEGGLMSGAPDPAVFIIFGATGDLARRNILSALYELDRQGCTESGCVILGVTREQLDDAHFRTVACDALAADGVSASDARAWAN